MADQNPVNWFEIPVTEMARARAFYERVFGFELMPMQMGPASMAMFPFVQGGVNAAGCLIQTEGYTPSHAGTVVYFTVADIEGTLARASSNGGSTLVPKMTIGEHGFIGQFQDTEGNRLGLHSMQ